MLRCETERSAVLRNIDMIALEFQHEGMAKDAHHCSNHRIVWSGLYSERTGWENTHSDHSRELMPITLNCDGFCRIQKEGPP
jgi:hypothetical protein